MPRHSTRPKIVLSTILLVTLFYMLTRQRSQRRLPSHSAAPSTPIRLTRTPLRVPVRFSLTRQPSQEDWQTAERLFPYRAGDGLWRKKNQDLFARLLMCQRVNYGCDERDSQIVLMGSVHFSRVTEGIFSKKAEFPAGEAIWADALLWGLDTLKLPYLVVDGVDHNATNTRLGEIYKLLGDNVRMVFGDYLSIPQCLKNARCYLSSQNPGGIPDHKLFVFDGFGQDVGHPLGRRWHLTFYPQEEKNFTYLGLTIEHYCHKFGVVPPAERSKKIYILGKDRTYLHPPAPTLYPETMWGMITNKTGVEFTIGTLQKSKGVLDANERLLDGMVDIGTLNRNEFIFQIQRHRAVIGLGWPTQPSTPLEALCVGTPFINPVWVGRRTETDRSKWDTQHPYLARFDPPYIYNVQDHREDDVLEAIEQIMKKPLTASFIPDDTKKEVYLKRIEGLVRFDWQGLAQELKKPSVHA